MKTMKRKTLFGLLALTLVGFAGCSNDSGGIPPAERKPGTDISAADRADKRGDVGMPPGSTAAGGASTPRKAPTAPAATPEGAQ